MAKNLILRKLFHVLTVSSCSCVLWLLRGNRGIYCSSEYYLTITVNFNLEKDFCQVSTLAILDQFYNLTLKFHT